jgi:hypothetical protein
MRQVIKPTDIQEYFGKKTRMSFKMMSILRKNFGKTIYQPITVDEFCEFYAVTKESVIEVMRQCDLRVEEQKQLERNQPKNLKLTANQSELKKDVPDPKPKHVPYQFSKRTC